MLEIASASTADSDTGQKRLWYAGLGIADYRRFDETGNDHGAELVGDWLEEGR